MSRYCGLHLPNGNMDLQRYINIVGNGSYTILHHQRGVLPELRRQCPDAIILVRMYHANWYATDPRAWARECAAIYREIKPYTKRITWANEQNLRHESGGQIGAPGIERWHYEHINAWNIEWLRAFRNEPGTDDAILHYPAFASGHSDDRNDYGYIGLDICRPSISQCPVLDRHFYWNVNEGTDTENGVYRVLLTHRLFPDKSLFIKEAGNFAVTDPRSPAQYARASLLWSGCDYVIGVTYFIADDPTGQHGANNLSRNPSIFDALGNTSKAAVLGISSMAYRFQHGFLDFSQKLGDAIGEPTENEGAWVIAGEYVGQVQRTTKGILQWYKPYNIMFFTAADGRIYSYNGGNVRSA